MSRYRPPGEVSSPYITPAGYARMKAEYNHLWLERRPEVVRALSAAAAEGDRSENAEYIYRKKELREIDRRVRYLQVRLPILKVIDTIPPDASRIYFGATIYLACVNTGDEVCYRIVGGDETDAPTGAISVDSPLARALLKKTEGDVVRITLPSGERVLEVVEVAYCPNTPENLL